ncbi:MAG: Gfo/Idh/MocA family oxidoreductase [Bryobacteraceae bacterium]
MAMYTRRFFMFGPLLAGAVPAAGFGSVASLHRLGYKSPNEKLNIAAIGAGGRGAGNIRACMTENIVALADVDATRAAETFKQFEKAAKYTDFRRMYDKEHRNIDAVIVSTPDHTHASACLWAMQLGKHVYCEKPLTRTVYEARKLTEAAARYRVATQMGNQGYSNEGARLAAEIIWSGEIGEVTEVHAWTNRPSWPQGMDKVPPPTPVPDTLDWDVWLGPAQYRPYTSGGEGSESRGYGFYLPFNWRGFLDFGTGSIGDMGCHILGSVNMALRLTSPTSVEVLEAVGRNSLTYPKSCKIRFIFPARGSMPPVTLYWYDARRDEPMRPSGLPAGEILIGPGVEKLLQECGVGTGLKPQSPVRPWATEKPPSQANGAVFIGTKGILTTDTYGASVRILPASRMEGYQPPPKWLSRSPGHHRDWIRACKGGEPACSDFSVAGPFSEWIVLGCVALRFEDKLEWDAAKMQVTNVKAANEYLRPKFRKGWGL